MHRTTYSVLSATVESSAFSEARLAKKSALGHSVYESKQRQLQ